MLLLMQDPDVALGEGDARPTHLGIALHQERQAVLERHISRVLHHLRVDLIDRGLEVGELHRVLERRRRRAGKLDGVVKTRDGALLVASWEASAILAGRPGEPFERLLSGVESPADIGYDRKRNRLLIPSFSKDALVLHDLDGSE